MDGFDEVGVPVRADSRRDWMKWSVEAAERVIARTAAGETLRAMCREPGMPGFGTVRAWTRKRPAFAAALHAARVAAGGPFRGRRSSYCVETAEAIFARLCEGEGILSICRDPTMPAYSTVYRWQHDVREFWDALMLARDFHAERAFERGREICEGVTPATAQAAKVQLGHLRWATGKLAPRKYGAVRPVHAEGEEPEEEAAAADAGPRKVLISVSHFNVAPDGVVFAIPPRNELDEQRYEATYGRAYDGPR